MRRILQFIIESAIFEIARKLIRKLKKKPKNEGK